MTYLMVAGGLLLLLFSGDLLVRGTVAIARRFGLSPIVISLTVVAFGTSAPELFICVDAALRGASPIALGNVVGSNVANILLVMGLPAILYPTLCNHPSALRNLMLVVAASLLLIVLCFAGPLGFWSGVILFSLIVVFIVASIGRAPRLSDYEAESLKAIDGVPGLPRRGHTSTLFILAGLIGMPIGANWLVDGSVEIARIAGVSEAVIGITVIAIGTSLPELATTVTAAFHRQADVAVGNVLGSNLFNILAILGITAMVAPIEVPAEFLYFDLWVMLAAALALIPFIFRQREIGRGAGGVFVAAYALFIIGAVKFGSTNGLMATLQ